LKYLFKGERKIVHLLLWVYDVENGSIKIDGKAISVATQNSLHHSIGIVVQHILGFNRDILYIICYRQV